MGTKHIHAEVIKAWADGEEIQVRPTMLSAWADTTGPYFIPDFEYRVKPKNIVVTRRISYCSHSNDTSTYASSDPNLHLEFSECGQLVYVEMIK